MKKNGFWYEIKKNKVLYAMFLPVAIYYILFAYIPMGGIVLAFKEFNYRDGILFSPWNGFKNFEYSLLRAELGLSQKTLFFTT